MDCETLGGRPKFSSCYEYETAYSVHGLQLGKELPQCYTLRIFAFMPCARFSGYTKRDLDIHSLKSVHRNSSLVIDSTFLQEYWKVSHVLASRATRKGLSCIQAALICMSYSLFTALLFFSDFIALKHIYTQTMKAFILVLSLLASWAVANPITPPPRKPLPSEVNTCFRNCARGPDNLNCGDNEIAHNPGGGVRDMYQKGCREDADTYIRSVGLVAGWKSSRKTRKNRPIAGAFVRIRGMEALTLDIPGAS